MSAAPRLSVLTAAASPMAVVLRRGPSGRVASIGWNRETGEFAMGQSLAATIYEHRSDLSPDGRHMVIFAGRKSRTGGALDCWTAVSRAPWLGAVWIEGQSHAWHGGGAFTGDGQLWLNGAAPPEGALREVRFARPDAFPHSTDGFHMGDLFAAKMRLRGWQASGTGYGLELAKPCGGGRLIWTVAVGRRDRALVSNALEYQDSAGRRLALPGWEWADTWQERLFWAEGGALWTGVLAPDGTPCEMRCLRDFSGMRFERIEAPYESLSMREGQE